MQGPKAGWAEVDITPPLGLPMGGRGPRFTPGASVLDPLRAQTLVLEDPHGHRTLWVSMDLIGMSHSVADTLRYELAGLTGVPFEAVILNFAHVHSGPMTTFDGYAMNVSKSPEMRHYEKERDEKIIRAACEAVEKLQPVTARLHQGRSDIGINRRNRNEEGNMAMLPNPDGVYNPDLWVLDLVAVPASSRAIVFCYGCHPVIVYGYAWDGISADYPGVCRNRLREQLGETVHCQFIQGLAGNVRPRVLADLEAGCFRKSTPADLEEAGAQLARDVMDALEKKGRTLDLDIAAAAGWFSAKRDPEQIPSREYWQELAAKEDELSRNLGQYWTGRLEAGLSPMQAVPWPIGLVRLTREHVIAYLAGEAVAEWQAHLRRWLGNDQLMVWGYSQETPSYLPTDELIPEGGYEAYTAPRYSKTGPGPFAQQLNEAARQRFLALARQMET